MSPIAIVAIPAQDDYVWKLSSEKIPHMTIMMLGDQLRHVDRVEEYLKHAVDTSLSRFGMDVDHRGLLGPQDADVLFFGQYSLQMVKDFRKYLLEQPDIRNAYISVEQFPQWTPHLTMGYPATPAKADTREYPGTTWVNFDKIALWTGDYEGVEFPLPAIDYGMAMSDLGNRFLSHYGVKGMHWGIRKSESSLHPSTEVRVTQRAGRLIKTSGGRNHSPHEDAINVAVARQKAKKSSIDSLSTEELKHLVARMNLEQQYHQMTAKDPRNKSDVEKFIKNALAAGKTVNDINNFLNSPAGKVIKTGIKTKLGKK